MSMVSAAMTKSKIRRLSNKNVTVVTQIMMPIKRKITVTTQNKKWTRKKVTNYLISYYNFICYELLSSDLNYFRFYLNFPP